MDRYTVKITPLKGKARTETVATWRDAWIALKTPLQEGAVITLSKDLAKPARGNGATAAAKPATGKATAAKAAAKAKPAAAKGATAKAKAAAKGKAKAA